MGRNGNDEIPIQPVDKPILCSPYEEPNDHWIYDKDTGAPTKAGFRRLAGYWYKTDRTGAAQRELFAEEERDDLPLVNLLRDEVRRWRQSGYRGATSVTRELLTHWASFDRPRPLFFCQREAIETIIYLAEMRIPGRSSRTGFKKFSLDQADLVKLLRNERPSFELTSPDYYPTLVDKSANESMIPLRRLGCKMATGAGKTVVMAMLISWAFCNRGQNPLSTEFPSAVLVCCPNITIYERLQVLRPENSDNYYGAFDLVPIKYRPLMQCGKVLVTNWHKFAPESEHKEGDKTFAVVNKGPETPEVFARRVLGDLHDRMPIMVFNDEGHHAWRPALADVEDLTTAERKDLEEEVREATVWIDGLDRLNNARSNGRPGVMMCVDLSATPFYIKGSGHPEGRPFPWLVSDFGLVDAIESGIVKIPRLPVSDTTGRPDPRYFRLWAEIKKDLKPAELLPGGRPKPDVIYREAEGALQQIAGQWVERFNYLEEATPGQEHVPPVLIIVCDNTDIAEVFYRKISGETVAEVITPAEVEATLVEDEEGETEENDKTTKNRSKKPKKKIVYGEGSVYPKVLFKYANRNPDNSY